MAKSNSKTSSPKASKNAEGSINFKRAIKTFLDNLAAKDPLFAKTYAKEGKNLDDCITYILNQVRKAKISGYTDSEIFGMAIHYYDEDKIDIGKPITLSTGQVVVNHVVELTDEEKKEAKELAIRELIDENKRNMKKKPSTGTSTEKKEDAKVIDINSQQELF